MGPCQVLKSGWPGLKLYNIRPLTFSEVKTFKKLFGKVVVAHPELTTDPACMQGKIGKIFEVAGPDEIRVRFDHDLHGKYMPSALLIVLPPVKIVEKLRQPGANIPDWQQACILKAIHYLLENEQEKAIRYVMDTDVLIPFCTETLLDWKYRQSLRPSAKTRRKM